MCSSLSKLSKQTAGYQKCNFSSVIVTGFIVFLNDIFGMRKKIAGLLFAPGKKGGDKEFAVWRCNCTESDFTHVVSSSYTKQIIGAKESFYIKNNSLNSRRLVWNKNEAIDILLYYTNMAGVTSYENAPYLQ